MKAIAGHYQLQELLGSGGTGSVWKAFDNEADRVVAIKFVPVERAQPVLRDRLRDEARVMASLSHPHLLQVFELGTDEKTDWIAMEYCPGGSLAQRLDVSGPLAPSEAVRVVLEVLDALQFAHERGVVHRDVKPANLLIGDDGKARLGDFGIARIVSTEQNQKTQAGLGSWPFMAPEQRLDASKAGPPADIYAAGATLYNLLTAATPTDLFLATDASPRWDEVPDVLRPVLQRATAADPAQRFGDAQILKQSLALLVPKLPTHTPRTPPTQRAADETYAPTSSEGSLDDPRPSAPEVHPTIDEEAVRALYIRPLSNPRSSPSMRAVPLPKARVDTERVSLLFRRTVVGLALVVGCCLGALHLFENHLLESPRDFTPEHPWALDPAGMWRGNWGRYPATLHLEGALESLEGQLRIELPGGHGAQIHATGSHDPHTGTILLTEDARNQGSPGQYLLHLSEDGMGLTGEIRTGNGEQVELRMVRQ